jgi:hypothetical protein
MIVVKRYGWRFGLGPGKDSMGVDLYTQRGGGNAFGVCGGTQRGARGTVERLSSCAVM